MKPSAQIRHSLLFLFDWGKSVDEACTAIQQAYGVEAINRLATLRWFQRFRAGDKSLQDKEVKVTKEDAPKNLATEPKPKVVADRLHSTKETTPPKNANSPPQNHKQISPFLIKKWEHIFTTFFDRNHSQQMDWGDFYLVVRRVRDVYGAESVAYAYARKTMEALWKGLCKLADSDDDNLISMDEWVELLKNIEVKHQAEPRWFNEYQNFMFKLFDVSGDGVVDLIEYVDGMSIYGYTYQECVESFKAFAIDSKGNPLTKIGPELWKKMFLDLFFSTDKTLPGNNLFGKLKNI